MAMVLANDAVWPVVAFGKSQFSVKSVDGSVHTPLKKPMSVSKDDYLQIFTSKGVCSRAAGKWETMLTPNSCCLLNGKEGVYPFTAFDVKEHPEQMHKLIPVPSDVAVKLFPKIHADVTENPTKYGLKLDDPNPDIRARHKQRLDIFLWTPDKCVKADADGNLKPSGLSPPLNGWTQCPSVSQIQNLFKELVVADTATTKKSPSVKSKGAKRKVVDMSSDGIEVKSGDMIGAMKRVVSIETDGCKYTTTFQDGRVYVTLWANPQAKNSARTAPMGDDDDERGEEEEDEDDDDVDG